MENLKIIVHPFGVEVFDASGEFVGGITSERCEKGPHAVAEAVECILQGLQHPVTVERQ